MWAALQYQELLQELTKREIKQRYKQSVLGYAWVILTPLAQMLVMAFVFSRILPVQDLPVAYPLFLYSGLLPWTLFQSSVSTSANALISNGGLLTKIYFPRVIFVQSTLLAKMVDFFLASSIFLGFMFFFQVPIALTWLWFIPLFLLQTFFTYGISLILSALNLFYRDIQYLLSFILMVWMYVTPVIYSPTFFPEEYGWVFRFNPIAVCITAYRDALLMGKMPQLLDLGLSFGISLLIYLFARSLFQRLEGRFADAL